MNETASVKSTPLERGRDKYTYLKESCKRASPLLRRFCRFTRPRLPTGGSARPSQSRSLRSFSPGVSPFLALLPRLFLPVDPHPAPPSYKPDFPRFPAPQPPQEPTAGNFCRPSAARCCPLTAGRGGSLPSPGPAGCRVPPPARPVGPPLIVASPRAGLATSEEVGGEGAQQEPARVSPSAGPNINKQASPNSPAAPSTSSIHPRAGGAKQTGLRSPAQRHIVRSCGSYLGLRARPGGGPSGAGAARGEEQRAAATRAGEGRGRPHAGRRPPSPRRGLPAGHGAAARRVLLLGRRRRRLLQPSSQRRAAPGVRSTFSRSFPHAASERGLLYTRAHPQTSRSLRKIKISGIRAKGVAEVKARQRCADLGVPSERRPREGRADAGGARPTQFVRRSPSAGGLRRPDWHPSRRPCGLGRETAAAPPHISGLQAEAERWPLPQGRLKARTLARGSWEVHGRATPRTATEGRCPPTIPRNSPGNWPVIRNHIQIEDLFQTRKFGHNERHRECTCIEESMLCVRTQ
ncbi:translation initiation factor IF-2-like [Lutra lutra]|uniref:translation initiation factor IF-2-like n=1 Tax=Lutra lutra TaxID=9657 RepID=UPI001FD43A6C|nr:translation initiation factor IF-2-like [Lutra lutra]